ncbi:MAG TPA: PP0621 family protein [Roseateles sp.]|uniref:PP0621 family protein n=1 Tax=Roseateles sp. TaxID=1971397 RepID=UPI002ED90006
MKYLLLLLLLGVLFFVLGARRPRPREPESRTPSSPPPATPKAMLRCAECGMHLPADEALPGKGGVFCSAAHRASFEARDQA